MVLILFRRLYGNSVDGNALKYIRIFRIYSFDSIIYSFIDIFLSFVIPSEKSRKIYTFGKNLLQKNTRIEEKKKLYAIALVTFIA